MKIDLVSMSKLPAARRQLRRSGIRLTVRYGQVYTIRATDARQPDTRAQLRMRNIMAQASALAKTELENQERLHYWTARAAELGYKTARGACVAHHIKQLRNNAAATTTATMATPAKTARNQQPPKPTPHHHRPRWRKTPATTAQSHPRARLNSTIRPHRLKYRILFPILALLISISIAAQTDASATIECMYRYRYVCDTTAVTMATDGSWKFCGLPGLIFEVYDIPCQYHYRLTGIRKKNNTKVLCLMYICNAKGGYVYDSDWKRFYDSETPKQFNPIKNISMALEFFYRHCDPVSVSAFNSIRQITPPTTDY